MMGQSTPESKKKSWFCNDVFSYVQCFAAQTHGHFVCGHILAITRDF